MYLEKREKKKNNKFSKKKRVKNKEAPIKCLKKLWQNCAKKIAKLIALTSNLVQQDSSKLKKTKKFLQKSL